MLLELARFELDTAASSGGNGATPASCSATAEARFTLGMEI